VIQTSAAGSNQDKVVLTDAIGARPCTLALAGHVHCDEHLEPPLAGRTMRLHQSAATIAPGGSPLGSHPSGITIYTVRDGIVDHGRFVPVDSVRPER